MSTISKLVLLATVAAALTIPAAMAQAVENVEVKVESSGNHCPGVTITEHLPAGGCLLTVGSAENEHLVLATHVHGVGEIVQSECISAFSARVQETGHGFAYSQALVNEPPEDNCGIEPCDEEVGAGNHPNIPWPFFMQETTSSLWLGIGLCIRPLDPEEEGVATPQFTCTVAILILEPSPHSYRLATFPTGSEQTFTNRSRCSQAAYFSISGQWDVTGTAEIAH